VGDRLDSRLEVERSEGGETNLRNLAAVCHNVHSTEEGLAGVYCAVPVDQLQAVKVACSLADRVDETCVDTTKTSGAKVVDYPVSEACSLDLYVVLDLQNLLSGLG
jgi:hypothetical protein